MAKDYYAILGVAKNATAEEIKKAFRTKAHQLHPDKATGDAEKFKEANEAYQVLSNQEKRQQYDQYGQTFDQARRNGGGPAGGSPFGQGFGGFEGNVDFGDLGDMFGDLFGFGGGRRQSARQGGRDILFTARIPFRTSVFGGEITLELKRLRPCMTCSGSGAAAGSQPETCSTCQGRGQVQQAARTILGVVQTVVPCPTCHGDGQTITKTCVECQGEGRREQRDTVSVKVPAGISAGQKIKLSGQGEAGRRAQASGDLFVEISVEADGRFRREDDDLLVDEHIPVSLAALGGQCVVKTMEGEESIKVPAGAMHGTVVTLKNHGVPHLRGRGRGDLKVRLVLEVPQKLSSKGKKLWQQLRDEGM